MPKPYTALEFHQDCIRAINECPQVKRPLDWLLDDLGLLYYAPTAGRREPELDAVKVFNFWRTESTLMKSGYYIKLPQRAKEVFETANKARDKAVAALLPQTKGIFKKYQKPYSYSGIPF